MTITYERGKEPDGAPVVYVKARGSLHFFDVIRPTYGDRPGCEIIATMVTLPYARQICAAFHELDRSAALRAAAERYRAAYAEDLQLERMKSCTQHDAEHDLLRLIRSEVDAAYRAAADANPET